MWERRRCAWPGSCAVFCCFPEIDLREAAVLYARHLPPVSKNPTTMSLSQKKTGAVRRLYTLLTGVFLLITVSCTHVPELGGVFDKGGTKGRRIEVSLSEQKAYLYQHGTLSAMAPISSGREGKGTPTGRFKVIQKSADHRSSLYGNYVRDGKVVKENIDVRKGGRPPGSRFEGVPMPYFLRFSGPYGLHAGNVPGYPASSGCVRLPPRHAKRFYEAVQIGTPVIVRK